MKRLKRCLKLTCSWIHDKILVCVFKFYKPHTVVEVKPNVYYVTRFNRAYDPLNKLWWDGDEFKDQYCKLHKDTAIEIADELNHEVLDNVRRL